MFFCCEITAEVIKSLQDNKTFLTAVAYYQTGDPKSSAFKLAESVTRTMMAVGYFDLGKKHGREYKHKRSLN